MLRELTISSDPIDALSLERRREHEPEIGAIVRFSGIVRGSEGETPIEGLEYEAFIRMAEHQFKLLFDELEKRWPIHSVRLAHRIGFVPVGETSLWVQVMAEHRGEAFAACQFLIDEMKRVAPIWKKPQPQSGPVKNA